MRLKLILCISFLLLSGTVFGADIAAKQLVLRGVDKITGRVSTMTATVHRPLTFGTLTIVAERCLAKPQEEMPENAAFLKIYEKTKEDPKKQVFNGWMFSSNPALSAMEHPIYDIWVLSCVNKDVTEDVVSPSKISREDDLNLVADDDNPALAEE